MRTLLTRKRILTFKETDVIHENIEKRLEVLGGAQDNMWKGYVICNINRKAMDASQKKEQC